MKDSAAEVFAWRTRPICVDTCKPSRLIEPRTAKAITGTLVTVVVLFVPRERVQNKISQPWKLNRVKYRKNAGEIKVARRRSLA